MAAEYTYTLIGTLLPFDGEPQRRGAGRHVAGTGGQADRDALMGRVRLFRPKICRLSGGGLNAWGRGGDGTSTCRTAAEAGGIIAFVAVYAARGVGPLPGSPTACLPPT